ncbi:MULTISPECIES: helix-turn-helix domain-containing protein [unclassified Halomonas]|uniref:helix-turn-helix domain-containing protein n=1 Tax=unclassified Halomonas TaxID=2609666 RepID=UPI0006DA76C5|nr:MULTISPECIES: helix-turn-helix domain-containing protein [unclassified Halomonas]KPQ30918.1 MAG: transcriptional regulator of ethanolamine operon EutR [Halomonas sp. HL-93]SBR52849.1 Helix-turn-helix domain-containing protein [Halomonas sp. HL-93]SNY97796.1 Helix-turn-helix domain-containing protein [Halomonas sp. hl-4]
MRYEVRSFHDSQQHAAAIQGWQQVYDQLGSGRLSSKLFQVSGERFQVFHEVLDKRVVQHGTAPKQRFCMAFATGRPPIIQGCKVGSNSVLLLRDGEEFLLHAPEKMAFLSLSVDLERLTRLADIELGSAQFSQLISLPGMNVPMGLLKEIKVQVCRNFDGSIRPGEHGAPALEKDVEDSLMAVLLDIFLQSQVEEKRSELAVSAYIVKKSQELALADPGNPLSVLELCERLRVSRRTLQNSFQRVAGMRPIEFLRCIRLNAVRRKLANSTLMESTVGDVAYEMGFRHLSHFSASYYKLFGEYPSETQRLE